MLLAAKMSSRATRVVNRAVDDLAEVVASRLGCIASPADNSARLLGGMKLLLDPQTNGAGGYNDTRPNRPGPQTNIAKAWQDRCTAIAGEAERLKRILIAQIEAGAIEFESVTHPGTNRPVNIAIQSLDLPSPLDAAVLILGNLIFPRIGARGLYRSVERPPGGADGPTRSPTPDKTPSGSKPLDLPPGYPRTVAEVHKFLHQIASNGFKEMSRRPQRARIGEHSVQLTIIEFKGTEDRFIYLGFFENKLVSAVPHEGKALAVAEQITKHEEIIPFTLHHFFPQLFPFK